MRALALMLVVAVPSATFAQQKSLMLDSPSYEQPVSQSLLPAGEVKTPPLTQRWYFWAGLGTAAAVIAMVIAGFVVANQSHVELLMKSQFNCGAARACDGWINPPAN
jgi:hypothetical protein